MSYDDADRLISVTDAQSPTPGVTTYGYDTENNLTDIWDAAQNHTVMTYAGPNPLTVTFPSGYQERYMYDGNDQLSMKIDRNGNSLYFYYDYQNRLMRKLYPDLGTNIDYSYDSAGRLSQVIDYRTGPPYGTYTFGYDNMGRLTSATTNYGFTTFGNETVQYAYDAASNRVSMSDPQNAPTTYGYDTLNRLTSLIYNNQTPGFTFGYDNLSRRTSLTRPNSVNTTYDYDPASHLLSVLHQQGSTVLDGATYTYDTAGNRMTRTDQRTGTTLTYGYDNIYQLLSATQGSTTTESYTYDIVGNRLSSLGVSPYTYNSSNELASTPSGSYTYDYNGNTKTKPDGTHYTWDIENELTQVVLPGSGGTVNFRYDPFGRRIQKSFTQGSITTTTNYLYDGPNLIEELDSSGNVLARYTQGDEIDEPLSEVRAGSTSYYQQDGINSVTSLSSGAGALANTYSYDSFGKLTASTGTLTNPFQFTGREFDPETGIYEYRHRYYDQNAGRFISEDPIAFDGGLHFYRYVNNNPAILVDPMGLYGWSDVLPAWNHYCDGSGTPWTTSFSSINWGNTTESEVAKIKNMVGGSCAKRTIPVSFSQGAQTAGADAYIIGRHDVKVQGTIQVNCNCTWSFSGNMSSSLGYDPYDFDASNRGAVGETLTWIGRHRCKGKPFNINLPGNLGLSSGGTINGKSTCEDCKKK